MGNIFVRRNKTESVKKQTSRKQIPPDPWHVCWRYNQQAVRNLFETIDSDCDGIVRGKELGVLANKLREMLGDRNPALSGKLGRRIMERHDTNMDRGLSEYEFMWWYNVTLPATHLFHTLDADCSGTLQGPEMRALADRIRSSDPDNPSFERLGKRVMHKADTNGDGGLGLEEFIDWFSRHNRC